MKVFKSLEELSRQVGGPLGTSEWIEVTQARIQKFADATDDHQWIHLDAERAKSGPFGSTVAHGFLTLSLLPSITASAYKVEGMGMAVNYGLNKVRFPAPLPADRRIRGHIKLLTFEPISAGAQITTETQIELEGSKKPVCVAEGVARLYVKS